jgi:hypothetical protein
MNPPYAFDGSRGGGMAYMAIVNIRDSTQGVVKIQDTTGIRQSINRQGLARARTLALDKLEKKEAVVPKEFEHPRRQYIAVGPQGRCYIQTMAKRGFLSY